MPGAIAYDVHVNLPDGTTRDFNGLDTTAFTATAMTGTGIFSWQVRAQYPVQSGGTVTSSYTDLQQFTRTVHAPTGATATAAAHELVFSWAPKDGAKQYNVQVSNQSTFSTNSSWTTDETRFSPDMMNSTMFDNGGTLYWRVQAIDADGNHGAFTAAQAFHLPTKLFVTSSGYFQKGVTKTVTITVKDGYGHAISGASVKVTGAGVVTTTKKTNTSGKAAFSLKATSTGTVSVTASKTNCVTGTEKITVFM
jgi:Big-like domain-containing protein